MRGTQWQPSRSLLALSGTLLALAAVAGRSPNQQLCLGATALHGASWHQLPRGWGWGVSSAAGEAPFIGLCLPALIRGSHETGETGVAAIQQTPRPASLQSLGPASHSTVKAHKPIKPSMLIGCDSLFCYLAFSY